MGLKNGKHVLIEKPIAMTSEDAQYLYDLGKRLNLFVGEGMWTRFFPVVEWTRMHLGEDSSSCSAAAADADATLQPPSSTTTKSVAATAASGKSCYKEKDVDSAITPIGHVRIIHADFSIDGNDVGPYPTDSLYDKKLGGGCSWTMLPYVIGAAFLPFGREPDAIAANGILPKEEDEDEECVTVGDLAIGLTLTFDTKPKNNDNSLKEKNNAHENHRETTNKSIASGVVSYLAESSETTMYAAKEGRITIGSPAHCPTYATMVRKSNGRGNGAVLSSKKGQTLTELKVEFPLPQSTLEIEKAGGFKMPNSMGFIYEAEAVRRLIGAGRITFPQWTPEESVGCIRTIETMLSQLRN